MTTEPFEDLALCAVEECKRLPVRMIWEQANDGVVDVVMLCRQHAIIYQPEGRVISDSMLPTAELDVDTLDVQITMLASESVLSRDWNSPEENEAWEDL